MMSREQAIFFEVMDDLDIEGDLEPLFFAYHDFILKNNITNVPDLEVFRIAKECIKSYVELQTSSIDFYDLRWDILETLDLDDAEWEYVDQAEI